jgi:hypothetical protein
VISLAREESDKSIPEGLVYFFLSFDSSIMISFEYPYILHYFS